MTSPTSRSKVIATGRKFVPKRVKDEGKLFAAARQYVQGDRSWARNAFVDAMTTALAQKTLGTSGSSLDIGSSKGTFAMTFADAAPQGEHHAFEPVPSSYETLRESAQKYPTITTHNVAVGAESGSASFVVGEDTGLSGFRTTQMMIDRTGSEGTKIEVEVVAIDDLTLPKISFVKIDVEGAELEVLRGAKEKFATDKPIVVFEHTDHARVYDESGTSGPLFDLASEMGYDVSTLDFALGELPPLDRHTFVLSAQNRWFEYFVLQPKQ